MQKKRSFAGALFYLACSWIRKGLPGDTGWALFDDDDSLEAEVELSPLKRDKDEVPMMMPQEKKVEKQESEQLHLVDNDVELPPEPILQDETERIDIVPLFVLKMGGCRRNDRFRRRHSNKTDLFAPGFQNDVGFEDILSPALEIA